MSNIEKVAKALYAHRQSVGDFPDGLTAWEDIPETWREEWREAAQALADAGLLMPDLPTLGMGWVEPEKVHPRPDLAPVSLTTHPTYLETLEDYENAPATTVITCPWEETYPALVKYSNGEWVSVGEYFFDSSTNIAGERRKVLYWPEEEKRFKQSTGTPSQMKKTKKFGTDSRATSGFRKKSLSPTTLKAGALSMSLRS